MHFSQKEKKFSEFLFQKKIALIAYVSSKLPTPKDVVK